MKRGRLPEKQRRLDALEIPHAWRAGELVWPGRVGVSGMECVEEGGDRRSAGGGLLLLLLVVLSSGFKDAPQWFFASPDDFPNASLLLVFSSASANGRSSVHLPY